MRYICKYKWMKDGSSIIDSIRASYGKRLIKSRSTLKIKKENYTAYIAYIWLV